MRDEKEIKKTIQRISQCMRTNDLSAGFILIDQLDSESINLGNGRLVCDAAHFNHLEFLKKLVEKGADLLVRDGAVFYFALDHGDYRMIEFLLTKHPLSKYYKKESKDPLSHTSPLSLAVNGNKTKIMELLVSHGAEVKEFDHRAIRRVKSEKAFLILAKHYSLAELCPIVDRMSKYSSDTNVLISVFQAYIKKLTIVEKMNRTFLNESNDSN